MAERALTERHIAEWAWFVIAIGAVLRFQGLDWDQGLMLNPDERNIATAAASLAFPSEMIPRFHAYNGLALYLPRLLAELISPWTGRSGSDVAAIVFGGRILSAFYASAALPVMWWTARRTLGIQTALLVVGCAAASPSLIQSAHFATTESGLVLCLVVMIYLCVRHVCGGLSPMRFAILAGAALGFGFGLKTTALAFAICPATAVAMGTLTGGRFWLALKAGGIALAVLIVMAMLTTPQLWATPKAYFETMRFESGVVSGAADVFWTYQFNGARNGLFELAQLPWLVGPAVAPLGLAGLCVLLWDLWRRKAGAHSLAVVAVFTIVYAAIICNWHAKFIRYLSPLVPMLILFAGYFLTRIQNRRVRVGLMAIAGAATALAGFMQAAIYQVTDPRIAAWEWLVPQLKAGDRLAVEPRDVGPPYWVPAATPIQTVVLPLLEASSPDKTGEIAAILAESRWLIIASRRHYTVLPRLHERFPEMCGYYDALWSARLGYRIVAEFRRRPSLGPALNPEMQAEETFTVFDSPEVIVLKNDSHMPASRIMQEMLAVRPACLGEPPPAYAAAMKVTVTQTASARLTGSDAANTIGSPPNRPAAERRRRRASHSPSRAVATQSHERA